MNTQKKIKSPCSNTCKYDEFKTCMGCFRSMYEIVNWPEFSDLHKSEIIARIEKKRRKNV